MTECVQIIHEYQFRVWAILALIVFLNVALVVQTIRFRNASRALEAMRDCHDALLSHIEE